jgi:TPR repeat protein
VAGEIEGPGEPLLAIEPELESWMDVRGLSGGPVVPVGPSVDEAVGLVVRRLVEPEEGKLMSNLLVACPARLFAGAVPSSGPELSGPDLVADEESTHEALAAAALAGDVNAAARLGHRLVAEGKRGEAEPWLRQAGRAGEPTAAFAVGMLIDPDGTLVERDPARAQEALVWFRRAATGGDIYGTTTMGIRLRQHGRSDAALPWLEAAVERGGDAMAAHTLARIYEDQGDRARAEQWERFSAEQGDVRAAYDLGRLLNDRGEREEAIRWLERATIDPEAVDLLRELGIEPE